MDLNNKEDSEAYALIHRFGDAAADVIVQMLRGEWVDNEGHKVTRNTAMIELKDCLNAASNFRDKVEGYEP